MKICLFILVTVNVNKQSSDLARATGTCIAVHCARLPRVHGIFELWLKQRSYVMQLCTHICNVIYIYMKVWLCQMLYSHVSMY